MVYHSLFDKIAEADPAFGKGFEQQEYRGTLEDVLDETGRLLISERDASETVRLALYPPRIIRAFVDYKVQKPKVLEVENLLRESIQLGLDIYRGEERASEELYRLKVRLIETGNAILFVRELKQPFDSITWRATNPKRSIKTAEGLVLRANKEPVLFVALAHGGVAAGMDTYLRYCDMSGEDNSVFYVARFSARKLGDSSPRLSQTEINYLQEQSQGRRVVLFDEDRASGKTLDMARQCFEEGVFPHKKVIVATNLDARGELIKAGFGAELNEIDEKYSDHEKHDKIVDLYSLMFHYDDNIINKIIDKKYKIPRKHLSEGIIYEHIKEKAKPKSKSIFIPNISYAPIGKNNPLSLLDYGSILK